MRGETTLSACHRLNDLHCYSQKSHCDVIFLAVQGLDGFGDYVCYHMSSKVCVMKFCLLFKNLVIIFAKYQYFTCMAG